MQTWWPTSVTSFKLYGRGSRLLPRHLSPPFRSPPKQPQQVLHPLKIGLELILLSRSYVRRRVVNRTLVDIYGVCSILNLRRIKDKNGADTCLTVPSEFRHFLLRPALILAHRRPVGKRVSLLMEKLPVGESRSLLRILVDVVRVGLISSARAKCTYIGINPLDCSKDIPIQSVLNLHRLRKPLESAEVKTLTHSLFQR